MTFERTDFATLERLPAGERLEADAQLDGWIAPFEPVVSSSYFALVADMPCCVGCVPRDARMRIEVFAAAPIAITGERVCLTGRLRALPVADPMRDGGMAVLCLAIVSDSPTHHVTAEKRIRPFRDPAPGELQAYGEQSFQRLHELARTQGLRIGNYARVFRESLGGAAAA
jgi:hypothetical protein